MFYTTHVIIYLRIYRSEVWKDTKLIPQIGTDPKKIGWRKVIPQILFTFCQFFHLSDFFLQLLSLSFSLRTLIVLPTLNLIQASIYSNTQHLTYHRKQAPSSSQRSGRNANRAKCLFWHAYHLTGQQFSPLLSNCLLPVFSTATTSNSLPPWPPQRQPV